MDKTINNNTGVVVLISTYNGEMYLKEQLDSLIHQTISCDLIVRDDGSVDSTQAILDDYQKRNLLEWYSGPNLRSAKSFLNLLSRASSYDYYAFCDQDDVWDSEKLEIAINSISSFKGPAMYCSDTQLVDSELHSLGRGGNVAEGTFAESLISNPVTGCTMVFNRALRDLVIQYQPRFIYMHDWWIYRLCMAVDGVFVFDKIPHILYRQHEFNVIGGRDSKRNVFKRHINRFFSHKDGVRYVDAIELYQGYSNQIKGRNKEILEKVVHYKESIKDTIKLAFAKEINLKSHYSLWIFRIAVLFRKF